MTVIFTRLSDPAVRNLYLGLDVEDQSKFDERAAFLEYEELLPRKVAEYKAFVEILKLRRAKYFTV
jgi:hypothetical protein